MRIPAARRSTLAGLSLLAAATFSTVGAGAAESEPSLPDLERRVRVLTAPEMAGRGSGTAEVAAAADTVASWMGQAGLEPAFDGSWFQTFPLSGEGWTGEDLSGKSGCNVAGVRAGSGDLADRWIVVGAHYDHLGRVEPAVPNADPPVPGGYYPGANDNASGVTALVELMRLTAVDDERSEGPRRAILFVSFGAEEVGLQGSGHLVSHLPVPGENIDLMINLDTVGQMQQDRLYVSGVGTAAVLPELVDEANELRLDLSLAQGGWSGSDHLSFNTREIPVLFLFGGPYVQYNTPQDTAETLDYAALGRVTQYLHRLTDLARRTDAAFGWVMVGQKDLNHEGAETSTDESQNRNTWFGSMPDFTEEAGGYLIAGVFDDSPAARAGLRKGDVLVRLADREVADLPTFTRALRAHGPGDLVEVRVLRDGKALNFTVVLGDRADKK